MAASVAMQLSGDVLQGTYAIDFKGKTFRVERHEEVTYVRDEQGKNVLGTVRPATTQSGSVWTNGDCIAEYYLVENEYFVVPIQNGFREPEKKIALHPILFLIHTLGD